MIRDFNLPDMNDNAHMFGNPYKSVQDARHIVKAIRMGRRSDDLVKRLHSAFDIDTADIAREELWRRNSL